MDNLALLVLTESLAPVGSRVSSVRKVTKAQEVSQDHPALSVCRACLAQLVKKEKRVTLVKWVRQVPLAPGARLALQERMVHKGPQGALETQELWERKVNLAKRENLVSKVILDHQVPEVREGKRAKLDLLVHQAPLVLKVPLEMMAPKVALVQSVSLVTQVLQESLAHLVWMVLLVTKEMMVKLDNLGLLVLLERLALQVPQGREVHMELQALREGKVKRVLRENLVLRVLKERLVQLVHKELQESLAQRVSGESPVRWVNKVSQVHLVQMALLVQWVLLVCQVSKVTLE